MQRKAGGYFTVEATMVLPIVLMVTFLIIYLLFFQYNRCLMEQDMGILALRGVTLQAKDNEDRIALLREQADALYDEKYIAWECGEVMLKLEKGTVSVKRSGLIRFPMGGIIQGNQIGEAVASYKNHIISPVSFIRNYRKIIGG